MAWERKSEEGVSCNDGNRSIGVCGRHVDDLCFLASATENVGLEVCGRCVDGLAGHILSRCLSLVFVRSGSPFLADHSDQFHHVASDGGDSSTQAALSSIAGC